MFSRIHELCKKYNIMTFEDLMKMVKAAYVYRTGPYNHLEVTRLSTVRSCFEI
jgi:hypothetical protein